MLSLLLPRTCGVCRSPGPSPCSRCASELVPAAEAPAPAGLESCRALIAYEGTGRLLVTALKYRNHREVLDHIAGPLAMLADPSAVDVVTWAPTTGSRRRDRGFDQARLLAGAVAQALRRPCGRLLDRLPGPPQTGKGVLERLGGPSFTARSVAGLRVLVVDDVVTTGSTLSRAAAALRREGATAVHGLALARTPRTGPAAVERAGGARRGRPGALKCGGSAAEEEDE